MPSFMPASLPSDFSFDPPLYEPLMFEQFDPVQAGLVPQQNDTPQSLPMSIDNSMEPSLDAQTCSNAQLVGLSGESDPYLLRQYRYNGNNECRFQTIRMRRMGDNECVPVHFVIQQNDLAAKAQPSENPSSGDSWRKEVKDMVSDDVGKRLIRLYAISQFLKLMRKQSWLSVIKDSRLTKVLQILPLRTAVFPCCFERTQHA